MDPTPFAPYTLPPPYLPPAFIGLQVQMDQGELLKAGDILVIQRQTPAGPGQWSVVSVDGGAMAMAQLCRSQGHYQVTLPQGPELTVPTEQIHIEGTLVGKLRLLP